MEQDERRSPASVAARQVIRDAAMLVKEGTYQRMAAPEPVRRILEANEPVVARDLFLANKQLLTAPRPWVRDLIATMAKAHFVEAAVVGSRKRRRLRLRGRWQDVQLAEINFQKLFLFMDLLSGMAYRDIYNGLDARERRHARGMRDRWRAEFLEFLKGAIGMVYEWLAEEEGVAPLRETVGTFDHVALPVNSPAVRRRALRAG